MFKKTSVLYRKFNKPLNRFFNKETLSDISAMQSGTVTRVLEKTGELKGLNKEEMLEYANNAVDKELKRTRWKYHFNITVVPEEFHKMLAENLTGIIKCAPKNMRIGNI
ncbi:MAG: hypothetical protein ABIH83_02055, partial [Candidatus Micrarchaeota archaeon]